MNSIKIKIFTILVSILWMVNCSSTSSVRPYAGVPELNEKLSVGPVLSGSACINHYLGGIFWSSDFKGYSNVRNSAGDLNVFEGAFNGLFFVYSLPYKAITGRWIFQEEFQDNSPNGMFYNFNLDPVHKAALYDALSKERGTDLLMNPTFQTKYDGSFFASETCVNVKARGITVE